MSDDDNSNPFDYLSNEASKESKEVIAVEFDSLLTDVRNLKTNNYPNDTIEKGDIFRKYNRIKKITKTNYKTLMDAPITIVQSLDDETLYYLEFASLQQAIVQEIADGLHDLAKAKMQHTYNYQALSVIANIMSNIGAPSPKNHKWDFDKGVDFGSKLNKYHNTESKGHKKALANAEKQATESLKKVKKIEISAKDAKIKEIMSKRKDPIKYVNSFASPLLLGIGGKCKNTIRKIKHKILGRGN